MCNGSKDNFIVNFGMFIRFNHFRFFADALTLSKTFFNTFMVFAYGAIGFWGVVPIYNYYFHGLPLTFPVAAWYAMNSDIFTFLPILVPIHFHFRFPYTDTYLSMFWIVFVYLIISSLIVANMTGALSSFEFTIFCYLNACIQTLSVRLGKIGKIAVDSASRATKRRSKAYEDIVYLVKHHLMVKR